MREFENIEELAAAAGTEIGVSNWMRIDQTRIDMFADATGDHQWIHIDPVRARAELNMPTIAHGFLTLSLIPKFMGEIYTVKSVKRAINYGTNKVRFTNMVPVGSKVRGKLNLTRATLDGGSVRTISSVSVEIEDEEKPALIAETITLMYE